MDKKEKQRVSDIITGITGGLASAGIILTVMWILFG